MNGPRLDMTDADFEVLKAYIRQIADIAGLRDWTFIVKREATTAEDAVASVERVYGRKLAVIYFCDDFRHQISDDQQRYTVIHELLHCHLAHLDQLVDDCIRPDASQSAWNVFFPAYRLANEYAIDGIADCMAPHLPRIPWIKAKTAKAKPTVKAKPNVRKVNPKRSKA